MDLTKYISLVSHRKLFFARPDWLGDMHEGRPSPRQVEEHLPARRPDESRSDARRAFRQDWEAQQGGFGVSCWYGEKEESGLLWDVYAPQRGGVAIISTVERVRAALGDAAVEWAAVKCLD